LRRDAGVRKYVLPLSIIGMLVSAYHYLEQKTDLFPPFPCQMGISCKADYLNWMGGVVTIPFLALMAFLLITFFMVSSSLADEETGDEAEQLKQPTLLLPVLVTIFVVLVCFGFMKALGV
jgi:disulfide bond formation protein DsbB